MSAQESPEEREARLLAEAEAETNEAMAHEFQEELTQKGKIDDGPSAHLGIANAIGSVLRAIFRP